MDKRGSVTQVEIFGQTYNVRAEGDSSYIHDLARFVDSRMKEVAERTATVDTTVDEFMSVSATWNNASASDTITVRNFATKVY